MCRLKEWWEHVPPALLSAEAPACSPRWSAGNFKMQPFVCAGRPLGTNSGTRRWPCCCRTATVPLFIVARLISIFTCGKRVDSLVYLRNSTLRATPRLLTGYCGNSGGAHALSEPCCLLVETLAEVRVNTFIWRALRASRLQIKP